MSFAGLYTKWLTELVPLESFKENLLHGFMQLLESTAFLGSWLLPAFMAAVCIFKSLSDLDSLASFTYDPLGPAGKSKETSPLKDNAIRSAASFWMHEGTYLQVPGTRVGHLCRGHYSAYHMERTRCRKEETAVSINPRLIFQEVWIRSEEGK